MSQANELAQDVSDLLSEFDERSVGSKVILIRSGGSAWDDVAKETVFTPPAEHELTGVVANYDKALVNGTMIHKGDVKFVATNAHAVTQQDKVRLDGDTYSVRMVEPNAYTGMDKVLNYVVWLYK